MKAAGEGGEDDMKLNVRRTVLCGFAFFSICTFWQMYNNVIPLILTNTFHMNETFSGAIMAADNVLALFLLPLFGAISDRCASPMGRRRPFILFGTLAAVLLMQVLPFLDNSYYAAPAAMKLGAFVIVLLVLLVVMGTYRSPAVAMMPDITPKPLRSKANAIINLMGALGGILYLVITTFLYSAKRTENLVHVSYVPLFLIVGSIMLVSLLVVMLSIDEPELNREMREYEKAHPEENLTVVDESGQERLPAPVKRSLVFLLFSIALWFIGYNAMETWFTTYASRVWGMSLGSASLCLTIATVGAILSYIPVGAIAARVGRKKTIYAGIIMMFAAFSAGFVYTLLSNRFHPVLYVLFVLIGIGWASINVNSLPMVVEMCKSSDIGKYTGMYYTFSMAAQTVTPIVAGWLLHRIGYLTFFPYAAVFMAAAFITMHFVLHGDAKEPGKKGLLAFDVDT
jgi:Na+/melibiose symporter-like transporter